MNKWRAETEENVFWKNRLVSFKQTRLQEMHILYFLS
jgi:hypothetical protein